MSVHRHGKLHLREGYFLDEDGIKKAPKRLASVRDQSMKRTRIEQTNNNAEIFTDQGDNVDAAPVTLKREGLHVLNYDPVHAAYALLHASDRILQMAHRAASRTLSPSGHEEYCKLMLTAIKCLLLAIKNFSRHLSPLALLIVHYKLALVYHTETRNASLAEDHCLKAAQISQKHRFVKMKLVSDLLLAEILSKGDPTLFLKFLDASITCYLAMDCSSVCDLLKLYKLNSILKTDSRLGLSLVQELCSEKRSESTIGAISSIFQTSLFLYRGSLEHARALAIHMDVALTQRKLPVQLKAMVLILKLLLSIRLNRLENINKTTHDINCLISAQQNLKWTGWNCDGTFTCNIPAPLLDGDKFSLDFQMQWLGYKEFMLLFNVIAGVSLLKQPHTAERKSGDVLNKAYPIANSSISSLIIKHITMSASQISRTSNWLHKVKYTIRLYQVRSGLMASDFESVTHLESLVRRWNKCQPKNFRSHFGPVFLPQTCYLLAQYYQHQGDFQQAKYLYLKARHSVSMIPQKSSEDNVSAVDWIHLTAIDTLSEVYVYSTMHLVSLSEYECNRITPAPLIDRANDLMCDLVVPYSNTLHRDLMRLFASQTLLSKFDVGFAKSDDLATLTYYTLLIIHLAAEREQALQDPLISLTRKKRAIMSKNFCYPFFQNLVTYILFCWSDADSRGRTELLEQCITIVSVPALNQVDMVIATVMLKNLASYFLKNNSPEKASIAWIQILKYESSLTHRLEILKRNAQIFTDT